MLKYHNREFPSDVTTVLESLNARIVVWDSEAGIVEKFGSIFAKKNCECFMSTNMSKKVKKVFVNFLKVFYVCVCTGLLFFLLRELFKKKRSPLVTTTPAPPSIKPPDAEPV